MKSDEKRSEIGIFRMTKSDKEMLDRMAKHYQVSMADMLHEFILERDRALTDEFFKSDKGKNWQPGDDIY